MKFISSNIKFNNSFLLKNMHDFSQDKHMSNINNKEIFSNSEDIPTKPRGSILIYLLVCIVIYKQLTEYI